MIFVARQQEVTVLIGVAHKGHPVAGVIHQPFWGADASGRTIWAIKGTGVHGIEVVKGKFTFLHSMFCVRMKINGGTHHATDIHHDLHVEDRKMK